jgi:hypothetical protein
VAAAQDSLTGPDGTVWVPTPPDRLTEDIVRQLVRRPWTRVTIERTSPGVCEVEMLDPAAQKDYGDQRNAGHVHGTERCIPDEKGLTSHVRSANLAVRQKVINRRRAAYRNGRSARCYRRRKPRWTAAPSRRSARLIISAGWPPARHEPRRG